MGRSIRKALLVTFLVLSAVTVWNTVTWHSTAVAANECEGGDCRK